MSKKNLQLLLCVGLAAILMLCPVPAGLSQLAWIIFSVYIATILGLLLRPYPEPVILIIAFFTLGIITKKQGIYLEGFSGSASWLIFTSFMISTAFQKTGLGSRVAYVLIRKLGKSTLGLGYVGAFTDLVLSPAIPSNLARTSAIVTPIFTNISATLGSHPNSESSRKCGAFFMVLLYAIANTTSTIFMTGTTMNPLVLAYSKQIFNIDISWLQWVQMSAVPGLIILAVVPWIFYKICKPEIKDIDNVKIADEALAKLGKMSRDEKILATLFILAVLGWLTGGITKIEASTIAIAFLGGSLLTGLLTWNDCLDTKSSWSTFFWFSGLMGLSGALTKAGFFKWLAVFFTNNISFNSLSQIQLMAALVLFSIVIRYIFASGTSYVAAMIPVMFTIAAAGQLPVLPIIFLLAFSASYASNITHYSGAVGIALFGLGYNSQKSFWVMGSIFAAFCYVFHFTFTLFYWKIIGVM